MRSSRDVYEQTEQDGKTNLFCLLADREPLTFQEVVEEKIETHQPLR